ncbi:MAG: hypothetical protein JOZ78_11945 [Chroococcidiopsidaceae cyanobacterium CP_BM_ER_R8_30]|nr:hypothetical protein [Chroococcidiopsidaceae cyanobacterium CP_BM_ER_R8_30]
MNIQHLRHSLKVKWLLYYRQNRPWLTRLRIWGTFDGQRRPSSSFILAALSTLEPELTQTLPFIVDLSNHPDQIVAALGLNFNPDTELNLVTQAKPVVEIESNGTASQVELLETEVNEVNEERPSPALQASNLPSWLDESCHGVVRQRDKTSPQPVQQPLIE